MSLWIGLAFFVFFWFGIAKQLKENGRGWFARNVIAGSGASFAFIVVIIIGALISPPSDDAPADNSTDTAAASSEAARPEWYEGGTLHKGNGLDWQAATDANKLATAGDFIAGTYNRKRFISSIQKELDATGDTKPMAIELTKNLNEAFQADPDKEENRKKFTNQEVSSAAVMAMVLSGWIKQ